VCVTSQGDVDLMISLSRVPGTLIATFGDMVRVPGFRLLPRPGKSSGPGYPGGVFAAGWDENSRCRTPKEGHLSRVGFETTAPTIAATALEARKQGLKNFFVFSAHKTVPRALKALLELGEVKLNGFLLPGHVSAIIGSRPYEFLAHDYSVPCVISGFEPLDILQSVLMLLRQVKTGNPRWRFNTAAEFRRKETARRKK